MITGAGRGMGTDIAKAALAAGYKTVATGRNIDKVTEAVGASDNLLVVKLDVTDPRDAQAAVKATVEKFGRIDVLVNNAGNFYAGFFEDITPEDFRAQIETNLFGPVNVTPRCPAPHAKTAERANRDDIFDGPHRRPGFRLGIFCVEVRCRGMDGVACT